MNVIPPGTLPDLLLEARNARIPRAVIATGEPAVLTTWLGLYRLIRGNDAENACWSRIDTLADLVHADRATIGKALAVLAELGCLD